VNSIESIDNVKKDNSGQLFLLFKHSTRCSISSMAKNRLENKWIESIPIDQFLYLDLIRYRDLSNYIATEFSVEHESPQVLILKNGEVLYTASHNSIVPQSILSALS